MPIFASCLLVLGLFGIVWLAIAWRFHLPFLSHPAGEPKVDLHPNLILLANLSEQHQIGMDSKHSETDQLEW